jgi:hypothetical protein
MTLPDGCKAHVTFGRDGALAMMMPALVPNPAGLPHKQLLRLRGTYEFRCGNVVDLDLQGPPRAVGLVSPTACHNQEEVGIAGVWTLTCAEQDHVVLMNTTNGQRTELKRVCH